MSTKLQEYDLSDEVWREYDFGGRKYRIMAPCKLYWSPGHTMHRVTDSENIVHCVPAPGTGDCVLKWKVHEGKDLVAF